MPTIKINDKDVELESVVEKLGVEKEFLAFKNAVSSELSMKDKKTIMDASLDEMRTKTRRLLYNYHENSPELRDKSDVEKKDAIEKFKELNNYRGGLIECLSIDIAKNETEETWFQRIYNLINAAPAATSSRPNAAAPAAASSRSNAAAPTAAPSQPKATAYPNPFTQRSIDAVLHDLCLPSDYLKRRLNREEFLLTVKEDGRSVHGLGPSADILDYIERNLADPITPDVLNKLFDKPYGPKQHTLREDISKNTGTLYPFMAFAAGFDVREQRGQIVLTQASTIHQRPNELLNAVVSGNRRIHPATLVETLTGKRTIRRDDGTQQQLPPLPPLIFHFLRDPACVSTLLKNILYVDVFDLKILSEQVIKSNITLLIPLLTFIKENRGEVPQDAKQNVAAFVKEATIIAAKSGSLSALKEIAGLFPEVIQQTAKEIITLAVNNKNIDMLRWIYILQADKDSELLKPIESGTTAAAAAAASHLSSFVAFFSGASKDQLTTDINKQLQSLKKSFNDDKKTDDLILHYQKITVLEAAKKCLSGDTSVDLTQVKNTNLFFAQANVFSTTKNLVDRVEKFLREPKDQQSPTAQNRPR